MSRSNSDKSNYDARLQLLVKEFLQLVEEGKRVDFDEQNSDPSEPAEQKSVFNRMDDKDKQLANVSYDARGGVKLAAIVSGVVFLLMLGAIMFYLKSGGRTVEITMDDPTAKVFIDGNHIEIDGEAGKVTLDVGEHEVTVEKDGNVFSGWDKYKFTVQKDKKNLLTIRLLDKPVDIASDKKPRKKQQRNSDPLDEPSVVQ